MSYSTAMKQIEESEEFSPTQKRILLATTIKNVIDPTVVLTRNFGVQLVGIAEGKFLPPFSLKADIKAESITRTEVNGEVVITIPADLNKPDRTTVSSLTAALGLLINPALSTFEKQVPEGVAWITKYFVDANEIFEKATLEEKKETMENYGKVISIYLRNNLPNFVDHITTEEQFMAGWLSQVTVGPEPLDTAINRAIIHTLFGTPVAWDIFNIYLTLISNPIADGKVLSPASADFMAAFLMSATAGV